MHSTPLLVLLCVVAALTTAAPSTNPKALFRMFKLKYRKEYATQAEEEKRFAIFQQNLEIAKKHNARNPQASFGVNVYADLSEAEFKKYHDLDLYRKANGAERVRSHVTEEPASTLSNATHWDWRTRGAVVHIKNQGQCGSCWAFSTIGNIEGQWFLAGHPLTSLSEQELVSCDTNDNGCGGGDPTSAYQWLLASANGTIATEASDPYESGGGNSPGCTSYGTPGAKITNYTEIQQDEYYMQAWTVSYGPISICIDATSFQTYTGGIMTDCESQSVDHCVLIVGFDAAYSTPYWIIKNSWGTSWGENGYIRVQMYTDQCLLTSEPSSAVVPSVGPTTSPAPGTPAPFTPAPSNGPTQAPGTPAPGQTPSPWTPAPSSGPTPAPWTPAPSGAPSGATFSQYQCDDWLCTEGCEEYTFSQNQCLQTQGGGSTIVVCVSSGLQWTAYASSDCSGQGQQEIEPINQCLQDNSGTYVYNVCPGQASTTKKIHHSTPTRQHPLVRLPKALFRKTDA